jgi:hypothetical protein
VRFEVGDIPLSRNAARAGRRLDLGPRRVPRLEDDVDARDVVARLRQLENDAASIRGRRP